MRFRLKETQAAIQSLKTKCTNCGETNPLVLEFDHLDRSEKIATVSSISSVKKAKLEIAKCQLLCKRCHTIKTSQRLKQVRQRNEVIFSEFIGGASHDYLSLTYRLTRSEILQIIERSDEKRQIQESYTIYIAHRQVKGLPLKFTI